MHVKMRDKLLKDRGWILVDNIKSIHLDPLLREIELIKRDGTRSTYLTKQYEIRFITED